MSTHRVRFVQTDIREWKSQVNAFRTAIEFAPHKAIDIVCPNAGVSHPESINPVDRKWLVSNYECKLTGIHSSNYS